MSLFNNLRRFRDEENGSYIVETILFIPLIFWAIVATTVFFDGFRTQYLNQKATYTIADAVSRSTVALNNNYVDNSYRLVDYIAPRSDSPTRMRLTVLCYNHDENRYKVKFSQVRGSYSTHTEASLNSMSDRLPPLANSDELILVEAAVPFEPIFNAGIAAMYLENQTFTRSRTFPIQWDNGSEPAATPSASNDG